MSVIDLFEFDKQFNKVIIGTDEAGRGPAAGGVYAAAVCFMEITDGLIKDLEVLNDSKKLTSKKRDSIYDVILNNTLNKIVCVEVDEIEKINILNSSLKAMNISCSSIMQANALTLVDGNKLIRNYSYTQQYIIKGDSKSASIAAASILAKVSRDRYMRKLDSEYPMYCFSQHKGYGTKLQYEKIAEFGISEVHRKTFLKKIYD